MIAQESAGSSTWSVPARHDLVQWFIWHEADLLDRQDYLAWLDLWAPSGLYIIPTEHQRLRDYAGVVNILYDDAAMRQSRVKRILSGFSPASAPSARTVRLISRFVVTEDAPDSITVSAAMLLSEYKYQHSRTLAADVDYRIAISDAGAHLQEKVVRLINADDYLPTIGYLL